MKSRTGAGLRSLELGRKLLAVSAVALCLGVSAEAIAKGGTAKPPTTSTVGTAAQVLQTVPGALGTPGFTAAVGVPANLTGFDVTGLVHNAVVDANVCVPVNAGNDGGTVIINGLTITIPCGTIVQMPANTLTWAEFVAGPTEGLEIDVVGNNVNGVNIGALVYVSQQSLNSGSGVISSIDYANGFINVLDGNGNAVKLKINDPNGRFSRPTFDDPRFSVDDENPTIHSGTGYPMCVPRTQNDPNTSADDDAECPKINRPLVGNGGCRNFLQAGVLVLPASGELAPPVAGDIFCRAFVMPAISTTVKGAGGVTGLVAPSVARNGNLFPPAGSVFVRSATQPDATKQAPLEVGDYIIWSGTVFTGTDYISVHTLEANVGIFTQPGTQPAYIAIGEFGLGASDPNTPLATPAGNIAVNIEATNRMFLEAATTDVVTPIDIYYIDYDAAGNEHNRWVTPSGMTGECNAAAVPVGGLPAKCLGADGGITTQYTGPQNQRARIRANKPPTNLLSQPTRYLRVVQRSLCKPTQTVAGPVADPTAITSVAALQNVCIANAAIESSAAAALVPTTVANSLKAGQYLAPVGEYIFPENTQAGQAIVPNDLWSLSYLFRGEGPSTEPLNPQPW